MQSALEDFGFEQETRNLACFINGTKVFASTLQSNIYPVLSPVESFGVYQTWK